MLEKGTQAEEPAVMDEGAAAEETAQEWNDEEFVSAFDGESAEGEGAPPDGKDAETKTVEEEEPADTEETGKEKLEIGGREYTASDVEGLLSRITELQAAANAVSPEREFVERMAAQAGMDAETFLKDGERLLAERQIQARTAQLMDQGLEENMARHVAELETERGAAKNAESARKTTETQAQDAQVRAEAQMRANVEEFARMFPDVKEIPDEVVADIEKTGATPVVAYQKYLLAQKEKELAGIRQAEKNRKQTTGSVKGTPKGAEDPFAAGFDSEFN